MPSVGLVLVVRAGSPSFVESIKSARAMVDHVTVVAADDTSIIPGVAEGCATHVVKMPASMADARNLALSLAGEHGTDYFLMLDPGDTLEGGLPRLLDADLYEVWVHDRGLSYPHLQLFRSGIGVYYEGDRSDEPVVPEGASRSLASKLVYKRWSTPPENPAKLAIWMSEHPNDARGAYDLAQAYRDAGQLENARQWYEKRITFTGRSMGKPMDPRVDDQKYVSALEIALLIEQDAASVGAVMSAYLRASEMRPLHAEPLFNLACYLREQGCLAAAWHFARRAAELPVPLHGIIVDIEVYEWKARAEIAIEAWMLGDRATAMKILFEIAHTKPIYKEWADQQLAIISSQDPPDKVSGWTPSQPLTTERSR